MENVRERFDSLLRRTLIPDFCSNAARNMSPSGFQEEYGPLSETDMAGFLRGWDAQLYQHKCNGLYRAARSGAAEKFFWSGRKDTALRTFTLWIEPIITLGVLARMYLDFEWPRSLIGAQSKKDWAFDIVGFKSEADDGPLIVACEIKKSRKEVDALIGHMRLFGNQPVLPNDPSKSAEKNAYRKVKALREHKPQIFWAVGPDRYEKIFLVQYSDDPDDDHIEFKPASEQLLMWKA